MELPEEIVMDILLRLPVKSLVRFKCVSNRCFSLITNPNFARLHLNRHRPQHDHDHYYDNSSSNSYHPSPQCSVILSYYSNRCPPVKYGPYIPRIPAESKIQCIGGGYREDAFEEAVDFDFPLIQGQSFLIKGFCNGLLCLLVEQTTLVLWNPSIREHRILPLPPDLGHSHADAEIFGLGYDSSIDDYKVVRIPSGTCREIMVGACFLHAHVFNLKSSQWRSIQEVPYMISEHHQTAIFTHGGLYWLAGLEYQQKDLILRFDLADETFTEIALPPPRKSAERYCRLGLWGGFLCMLRGQAFWVMKGDSEEGWTKLMTIPKIPAPQDSVFSSFLEPLCLTKSGKVLIVVACVKFVLYDPREQTVRELDIRGLKEGWFQERLYFESLVSPYAGNV